MGLLYKRGSREMFLVIQPAATTKRYTRMCGSRLIIMVLAITLLAVLEYNCAEANPAIMSYDMTAVCIRNCAQCKKMYGPWFEGQSCADACVRFKGKIIPDCEDISSIAPFLNKVE